MPGLSLSCSVFLLLIPISLVAQSFEVTVYDVGGKTKEKRHNVEGSTPVERSGTLRTFGGSLFKDGQAVALQTDQHAIAVFSSASGSTQAALICEENRGAGACRLHFVEGNEFAEWVNIPWQRDFPYPVLTISETNIAWAQPSTGFFSVLDRYGNERYSGRAWEGEVSYERSIMLDWNAEGTRLLIASEVDQPYPSVTSQNIRATVLSVDGRMISDHRLTGKVLSAAAISRSGNLVAVSSTDPWSVNYQTSILNLSNDRENMTVVPTPGVTDAIDFQHADRKLLLRSKKSILLHDLKTAGTSTLFNATERSTVLEARFLGETYEVGMISGTYRFVESDWFVSDLEIALFDATGSAGIPMVVPGEHRSILWKKHENGVHLYSEMILATINRTRND